MPGNANISRLVELEVRGIGADTVTILAQATRELQARFNELVASFDQGETSATGIIAGLRGIASGMAEVNRIASADADAMARAMAETEKFIEKTTAALGKKDAEEARLDAQARARLDARAAKDQAALDAIGAAADKAARAAKKAADDMAASDARKDAANARALADAEGYEAMQRKLGEMERRTAQESRDAIASTTAARQHGTEAVAAFIARTREEIAAEQAERASQVQTTAATREQIQALKDMGIIQDKVNVGARSGAGAFGGFASAAEQAADKNKRMGYAMLNVSYAVQDLQYGMGAVANNIGLVTQSIGNAIPKFASMTAIVGGPAGVGAILMGLGVAADILYHNWDKVTGLFGQGVPPKLLIDLDAAKKHLEELEKKKWKTDLDYRKITEAREELRKLTEEESAYEALKNKRTREQQKRAETVEEAIVEGGGGDDRTSSAANVASAVEATMPLEDTAESIADKAKVAEAEARMKAERPESMMYAQWKRVRDEAADRLKFTEAAQIKNRRKAAEGLVTRAAGGNELALSQLGGMFQAHPEAFAAAGVDPLRFGAGLEMAAPDRLFAEERRKHEEETRKKDEAAIKKRADEADAAARNATSRTGAGYDESLEKEMYDAIRAGTQPGAAMDARKAGLAGELAGRGVKADAVAAVAENLLNKAVDAANNLIAEGKKPRLDVKADAEKKKADRDKKADDDKADRDKKAEIKAEADRVGPGYEAALERTMRANMAGVDPNTGMPAAPKSRLRSYVDLMPQLGARLAHDGIDEAIAADVARAILGKVARKIGNQVTGRQLAAGVADPTQAVRGLAAEDRARANHDQIQANAPTFARQFQQLTGANDLQAEHAGKAVAGLVGQGASVEAAHAAVFAQMTGHLAQVNRTMLRMLAAQERAMGIIGNASAMLNQIEARVGQHGTKINQAGQDQQRNRNMKPSSSMMLGF